MLGYEHIEITIDVKPHRWLREQWQWQWQVWVIFHFPNDSRVTSDDWAKGIEANEANATKAAILAREEIWELLRRGL